MSIFTTASTPFRTSPTPLFLQKGDINGYPGTVKDSKTFGLITGPGSGPMEIFRGSFASFVAATAAGVVDPKIPAMLFNKPSTMVLPYPTVGVAYDRPTEDIVQALSKLSFIEDTHGKTRYFRGTIQPGQEGALARTGPKLHCFIPAGLCDYQGLKAFAIASKLTGFALRSFPLGGLQHIAIRQQTSDGSKSVKKIKTAGGLGSIYGGAVDETMSLLKGYCLGFPGSAHIPMFKRGSDLPDIVESGCFLPYFAGMLVPDKTTVPDIITSLFSQLLGSSPDEIAETASTLSTGWGSVASTPSGLALTHMLFCVSLALSTGTCPIIFMKNEFDYQGTVLSGSDFMISSKGKTYKPVSHEELVVLLKAYDSHEDSLDKIASIMSTLKVQDDPKSRLTITPEMLTSPRLIHNLLRNLIVPAKEQSEIRSALAGCQFRQKFFEAKDPAVIVRVFTRIAKGEFLDDEAPLPYINSDVIFTKECDYSTLSAFGLTAPSFYDPTGNPLQILKGSKDNGKYLLTHRMNEKGKPVIPNGQFPVFVVPLKEALDGFRAMKKNACISFRTTTRGTVASTAFVANTEASERIAIMLGTHYCKRVKDSSGDKKRKNVDDLSVKEINDLGIKVKKIKLRKDADTDFWSSFGNQEEVIADRLEEAEEEDEVEMEE